MTGNGVTRWVEAVAPGERVTWRTPDGHEVADRTVLVRAVAAVEAVAGSFDAIRQAVRGAICHRIEELAGVEPFVWVCDLGPDWAVYEVGDDLYMVTYQIDAAGAVTLGEPVEVVPVTTYQPTSTESDDAGTTESRTNEACDGRFLERVGTSADGSRIFRVLLIKYGDSLNGRRYTEAVMRSAAPLYEGAKAYDHHRTAEELTTSTIAGLVGTFRNIEATDLGIEADFHLLRSAVHTAEALDAALDGQAAGLPPLVGLSQDVQARWRSINVNGRVLQEATEILSVNSVDVVAHPAAGGQATRMVASSDPTTPSNSKKEIIPMLTLKQLLELLRAAESAQRPALLEEHASVLEAAGIDGATAVRLCEALPTPEPNTPTQTQVAPATEAVQRFHRASISGRMIIRSAVEAANLGDHMVESIAQELGDTFTEAEVTAKVTSTARLLEHFEKQGLAPTVRAGEGVKADEIDKKSKALDAMLAGNFREGYRSLKQAYLDIAPALAGNRQTIDPFSQDFNRQILRESVALTIDGERTPFDSTRAQESVASTTWGNMLGDSITRRMVAEYSQPSLSFWRNVVSSIIPVSDFRTQRIERMGGYGVLPAVAQGAPYQPLTSPGNDTEPTYTVSKRGGTEDLTLEAIMNDDVRAVQRIPQKLGLAAAQTLFRFVFDFFDTNPNIYDSVALFAAGHANTDTNALSGANLSAGRKKMRKQKAYGDSYDLLSLTPKFLLVCSDLEEIAFQLATSAVALPSGAPVGGAANTPNLHQGITPLVVDYWTSTTSWFCVADPALCPTIELGFLQGQEDPALFVQNDDATGSVFSADKVTWKIRHIYSGAVVDYRGLYRGNA